MFILLESPLSSGTILGAGYPGLFIINKKEGTPIPFSDITGEEEWLEMRSKIDELLRNGGSSSELQLVLEGLWP